MLKAGFKFRFAYFSFFVLLVGFTLVFWIHKFFDDTLCLSVVLLQLVVINIVFSGLINLFDKDSRRK